MKPHKWQKEIIAWANGAEIQYKDREPWDDWHDCGNDPDWNEQEGECYFRIKPEPKPDVVRYCLLEKEHDGASAEDYEKYYKNGGANLKLTFDGETGELKSAEVLK